MRELTELLSTMAYLRDPEKGCPWDRQQDFATIAPYTLEEAYEVLDAIERKDYIALQEELGDLLLQVIYHAQIASEKNLFCFDDVITGIQAKLSRRHPHLQRENNHQSSEARVGYWEKDKERQRQAQGYTESLDGLAANLPALHFAQKLQSRAAHLGFDWKTAKAVLDKVDEEVVEVKQAVSATTNTDDINEEIGDLLFTVVNLARHLSVNAELALRASSHKFTTRFNKMERLLKQNQRNIKGATMEQMQAAWEQVKAEESRQTN